jgi:uridine kinase
LSPRPVVVGVAGGSGSGKTTVVGALVRGVEPDRVALLHYDSYYRNFDHLLPEERAVVNFDHPESLETPLLVHHLQELLEGRAVEVPVYDFTTHRRVQRTLRVEPAEVILVDGILVLAEPSLRQLMDIRIYVDTDPDLRFIRRLVRDIQERGRSLDAVVRQYLETVRPMHLDFVEPSKRYADLIVPEGGENRVAVDMLVTKVRSVLGGSGAH